MSRPKSTGLAATALIAALALAHLAPVPGFPPGTDCSCCDGEACSLGGGCAHHQKRGGGKDDGCCIKTGPSGGPIAVAATALELQPAVLTGGATQAIAPHVGRARPLPGASSASTPDAGAPSPALARARRRS